MNDKRFKMGVFILLICALIVVGGAFVKNEFNAYSFIAVAIIWVAITINSALLKKINGLYIGLNLIVFMMSIFLGIKMMMK